MESYTNEREIFHEAPVLELKCKRHCKGAVLPERKSEGAAGFDLCACENATVPVGGAFCVKTGVSIEIPDGHYGRVAGRSGLALRGLHVGAGVIDSDFRGQIGVIMFNSGQEAYEVVAGDRVAQLMVEKISLPKVVEVEEHSQTVRGAHGFGSTGL